MAAERALSISKAINYKGLTLSIYTNPKYLSLFFVYNRKPLLFKVIPLNDVSEVSDHIIRETSNSSILKINKTQIESAFISGEDIPKNLTETLKKVSGLEFITFNPFDKIRPITELYENRLYLEKYSAFAPAAGIAFRIA